MSLEIKKNLITYHYLTDHVPLLEFLKEHFGYGYGKYLTLEQVLPETVPLPSPGTVQLFISNDGKIGIKFSDGTIKETGEKVKVSATDSISGYLIDKLTESNTIGLINLGNKLQVVIKDNSVTSSHLTTDALSLPKVTNNLIITDLENNFVGINTLFPQYTLDVNGKIQTTEGVVLIAPSGSKWLLKVDDNGVLYTERIS